MFVFGIDRATLERWAEEHKDFEWAIRVEPTILGVRPADTGLFNWLKDYRLGAACFIAQSPIGFPSRKEHPRNEHRPKEVALFPAVRAEFVEKGCGPAAQYCFSA
jgi:hypothetical protein